MVNSQSQVPDITSGRTGPEIATPSLEQFGYKQGLKRSLSLFDHVVYGLVIISPATFGIFGIVFNASEGMVPLVYSIGLVPILFTAMGYAFLSREFPVAGSVYSVPPWLAVGAVVLISLKLRGKQAALPA
jgi:hypothetical protein